MTGQDLRLKKNPAECQDSARKAEKYLYSFGCDKNQRDGDFPTRDTFCKLLNRASVGILKLRDSLRHD